jgi:hypothetical protein
MFRILGASKDTTITDISIEGDIKSGSNQGYSEIADIFSIPRNSSSLDKFGKSRILIKFDLVDFSASIVSGLVPTSSVQYRLFLESAEHDDINPRSFDISVHPITGSTWDEGLGLENVDEGLHDSGFANWNNATSIVSWATTGSVYLASPSASQHFDSGDENIDIDVSNIVYAWLTGGIPNEGFVVKLSDACEQSSEKYYIKRFYTRHAHLASRRPRLYCLWDSHVGDDRSCMKYGISGNLYWHNFYNGSLSDVASPVYVDILNSSSTVIQTITSSRVSEGVYYASGVFVANPTSSTVYFRDVWFNSSVQYFTGSFSLQLATGSSDFKPQDIKCEITNIKPTYSTSEIHQLRILFQNVDYRPSVRSSATSRIEPLIVKDAYIEIKNSRDNETLVSFSTGSLKYSKLSYDSNGNYISIDNSCFQKGQVYSVRVLANYLGQRYVFDKGWTIKIEDE